MYMIPEKSQYIKRDSNGREHWHAALIADTTAELVGVTGLRNTIFEQGSAAVCIKNAEVCVLGSDNKWYKQSDGSEVTA